jgi:hypothetical protein
MVFASPGEHRLEWILVPDGGEQEISVHIWVMVNP